MATEPSSQGNSVRPLGHLEKWYSASHMHGVMLNVSYGALLTTDDPSQLPTQQKLVQAMQLMCQRRPMLCASIFDDDNATAEWRFLPADRLAAKINAVVSISNDTLNYDEQLRKLTVTKVTKEDGNELLWKLVAHVPTNSTPDTPIDFRITFVAHHALLDGRSGSQCLSEILQAYDDLHGSSHVVDVETLTATPCCPPHVTGRPAVESCLDVRPSWFRIIKEISFLIFPFLIPRALDWRGGPAVADVPFEQRSHYLSTITLEPSIVQKLVEACRQNKTTVHSALMVMLTHAVGVLAGAAHTNPVLVNVESAVDLRAYVRAGMPSGWGSMVCGATVGRVTPFSFEQTPFWGMARSMKQDLVGAVAYGCQAIGLMAYVSGPRHMLMQSLTGRPANARTSAMNISNLGCINFREKYSSWTLQHCWFGQSKCGEGPVIQVSIMTTLPQNIMSLTFSFISHITPPDASVVFLSAFRAALDQLLVAQ